jgi:hypothetical protein
MPFAARGVELRCFAAKNFQTVEKTVKSLAVALARACGIVHAWVPPYGRRYVCRENAKESQEKRY